MRTNLVIAVLLGVAVVAAACNDATAPKPAPRVATIYGISTTAHAGTGDTVKVSFNYFTAGCDTGVVISAQTTGDGTRFTVTSWPTNRPCTLDAIAPQPFGFIQVPPHSSPLRFVFTQPGGTDSVRVVGP